MFSEGKTVGPRTFSWITGFVLLTLMFFASITGYILIWDQHALFLAVSGTKIVGILPIFKQLALRSFSGESGIDSSIIFINLFAHIASAFVISLFLWIHTSRITNINWTPEKKTSLIIAISIISISIIYPLNLLPEATMLELQKNISIDWFLDLWLILILSEKYFFIFFIIISLFIVFLLSPWWWGTKNININEKANFDINYCESSKQCAIDCPYDAISMTKNENSEFSELKVTPHINKDLCVSCGICSGSCNLMHIGPPSNRGINQIKNIENFIKNNHLNKKNIIVIYCCLSYLKINKLKKIFNDNHYNKFIYYQITCVGSIHIKSIETFSNHCLGSIIISCSSDACKNREGPRLFTQRIQNYNFAKIKNMKEKICFISADLLNQVSFTKNKNINFKDLNKNQEKIKKIKNNFFHSVREFIFYFSILCLIALISNITYSYYENKSILRLSWRLIGQKIEFCKQNSATNKPKHMQNPKGLCEITNVNYKLKLSINNKEIINKVYSGDGIKGDGAIFVSKDMKINPGISKIKINFNPTVKCNEKNISQCTSLIRLNFENNILFKARKIKLITFDFVNKKLFLKKINKIKKLK
jgi:ferredoxin